MRILRICVLKERLCINMHIYIYLDIYVYIKENGSDFDSCIRKKCTEREGIKHQIIQDGVRESVVYASAHMGSIAVRHCILNHF